MTTAYGYIRTSRQRIQGTAGSDPEAQAHQLRQEGVPEANIYRDVGVSGGTGTNSRAGWRALNARLVSGDILVVVAIDRIGRRWMDTVNAVRDLRTREVRIRSLAQSEATWVTYLASEPARIPHLAQTSDAVNRQLSGFSSRYMNLLAVFQI